MIRSVLVRRIPYAILLAILLVTGTLVGGALYEAANPGFQRIVWLDRDPTDQASAVAVRRALFADGRFLALTSDGYRAGLLDAATTGEIFAAVREASKSWKASYDVAGVVGARMEIELDGRATTRIEIANPDSNLAVPAELARVLRLLAAADRPIATVAFSPSSLRFTATQVQVGSDERVDVLPPGFPLTAAAQAGGVVITGTDLSIVGSVWTDINARLDPSQAHRVVEVDGQRWRIAWQLDVDAVGPRPSAAAAP
jgi:hypothetical protein